MSMASKYFLKNLSFVTKKGKFVILPQHNQEFLTLPHKGTQHPLKNKLIEMVVCLISGNSIKQEEFHHRLPNYSGRPGEGYLPIACT